MSPPVAATQAARHPVSRWYLLPLAEACAAALRHGAIRPGHVTLCGLAVGLLSALWLAAAGHPAVAAAGVLLAWWCDRVDGLLARRQGTATAYGAWLDANVDELLDVVLHTAAAWAIATQSGTPNVWPLLAAFLAGKYLFMHGLFTQPPRTDVPANRTADDTASRPRRARLQRGVRRLYHLPGNADVRWHLLAAALVCGLVVWELALLATYYHVRWLARYALLRRRLDARREPHSGGPC
jgi:phosphatidylglycerophosphate synthase